MPLRVLLKGNSFSPMYWKNLFYGLVDIVRQIGYPTFFITIAPYEWSFLERSVACLRYALSLPSCRPS